MKRDVADVIPNFENRKQLAWDQYKSGNNEAYVSFWHTVQLEIDKITIEEFKSTLPWWRRLFFKPDIQAIRKKQLSNVISKEINNNDF
jgi:hypothetical protein